MFIIVTDQSLFAVYLNVNKLNVTLIWQTHTSNWQKHIAGAASAKAELGWCCFILTDFLATQCYHTNLTVIYLLFWFLLPYKQD